jgi:hypothetical protein
LFAQAIRSVVTTWCDGVNSEHAVKALSEPRSFAAELLPRLESILIAQGVSLEAISKKVMLEPYTHLQDVFEASDLAATPTDFVPIPDCKGTIAARAAAVLALAAIDQQPVSYGSENGGALFVNLVVIPGEGKTSEKSKSNMRGHTDAASFPPRGSQDPESDKIAPSPDLVCLAALRNPDRVDTTVMPLPAILKKLPLEVINELEKAQFQVRAQQTFVQGTTRILGRVHIADGVPVLFNVDGELGIRFSHKNVMADEEATSANEALDALKEALAECIEQVVLRPGDILLVNNRAALHGRSEVGEKYGGETRWLLRTYGLVQGAARENQFHSLSTFMLFP